MTRTMTRQQIRDVDRWAAETLGLPGLVLMENAGRCVCDQIVRLLGNRGVDPASAQVAVLAGAGNNGGDGLAAARHLRVRGIHCDVFLVAVRATSPGTRR